MRIRVTQEHIDNGRPWRADSCPVACALQEQTDLDRPVVQAGSGKIGIGGVNDPDWKYQVPEVGKFAVAFDHERPVAPFEFDLPIDLSSDVPNASPASSLIADLMAKIAREPKFTVKEKV